MANLEALNYSGNGIYLTGVGLLATGAYLGEPLTAATGFVLANIGMPLVVYSSEAMGTQSDKYTGEESFPLAGTVYGLSLALQTITFLASTQMDDGLEAVLLLAGGWALAEVLKLLSWPLVQWRFFSAKKELLKSLKLQPSMKTNANQVLTPGLQLSFSF